MLLHAPRGEVLVRGRVPLGHVDAVDDAAQPWRALRQQHVDARVLRAAGDLSSVALADGDEQVAGHDAGLGAAVVARGWQPWHDGGGSGEQGLAG